MAWRNDAGRRRGAAEDPLRAGCGGRDGPRLPVGKVLGSAFGGGRSYEFAGPLLDRCNESEFNWVMDEVPNAVRSARVVVTTLERASLAGAREAFAHICRAGQPISEEDFEAALAWQPGRP